MDGLMDGWKDGWIDGRDGWWSIRLGIMLLKDVRFNTKS